MNIDMAHSTWLTLGPARVAMVVGLVNAMPDSVINLH
jgi:hypothetical protein